MPSNVIVIVILLFCSSSQDLTSSITLEAYFSSWTWGTQQEETVDSCWRDQSGFQSQALGRSPSRGHLKLSIPRIPWESKGTGISTVIPLIRCEDSDRSSISLPCFWWGCPDVFGKELPLRLWKEDLNSGCKAIPWMPAVPQEHGVKDASQEEMWLTTQPAPWQLIAFPPWALSHC